MPKYFAVIEIEKRCLFTNGLHRIQSKSFACDNHMLFCTSFFRCRAAHVQNSTMLRGTLFPIDLSISMNFLGEFYVEQFHKNDYVQQKGNVLFDTFGKYFEWHFSWNCDNKQTNKQTNKQEGLH